MPVSEVEIDPARALPADNVRPGWQVLGAVGITVLLWVSAFVAIRAAGREFSPGALTLGLVIGPSMAGPASTPTYPRPATLETFAPDAA